MGKLPVFNKTSKGLVGELRSLIIAPQPLALTNLFRSFSVPAASNESPPLEDQFSEPLLETALI